MIAGTKNDCNLMFFMHLRKLPEELSERKDGAIVGIWTRIAAKHRTWGLGAEQFLSKRDLLNFGRVTSLG